MQGLPGRPWHRGGRSRGSGFRTGRELHALTLRSPPSGQGAGLPTEEEMSMSCYRKLSKEGSWNSWGGSLARLGYSAYPGRRVKPEACSAVTSCQELRLFHARESSFRGNSLARSSGVVFLGVPCSFSGRSVLPPSLCLAADRALGSQALAWWCGGCRFCLASHCGRRGESWLAAQDRQDNSV